MPSVKLSSLPADDLAGARGAACDQNIGAISAFGTTTDWDIAVVVPAKDEADRITGCLSAIAYSAAQLDDLCVGLVVVVNNTSDDTADLACKWALLGRGDLAVVVVEHHFVLGEAGVGQARQLGFALALDALPVDGVLMMTDADTHVSPTWIADNLGELRQADVVCGRVEAIAEEQAALPVEISQH